MPVWIWGKVESGTTLVKGEPAAEELELVGVSLRRRRPTRDRLWSALVNSGLRPGIRGARLQVLPPIRAGGVGDLDLALALAFLGASGFLLPAQLRRTLAVGRLRLDGSMLPVSEPLGPIPSRVRRIVLPAGSDPRSVSPTSKIDALLVSNVRAAVRDLAGALPRDLQELTA